MSPLVCTPFESSPLLKHSHTVGCGCGIDIHAHLVPENFPRYLGSTAPSPWPYTEAAPNAKGMCHRQVMFNGKHYRTVSEQCWSTQRRLVDLPEMGLSNQVVSPMPELLSYWISLADAQGLIRFLNEQTAAMCADSGHRLLGLAAVPLQDVDAAILELRHAHENLSLVGVEIGSNINGTPIGDAKFDAFYEACVALDMPVFVHALKPAGMDRLIGPPALEQVLGYPTDVGLAAASVITGGLMQRHPRLRIAFSHGGGSLASLLPRLTQGWKTFPALADRLLESPLDTARRLYYDTLVYDSATLRHLIQTFGADQLMLGTDYPFNFHEPRPIWRLSEAGLDQTTQDALAFSNALRFLGQNSGLHAA
jgi:aminocarboxymuconate-semialdehyde decarboxylase